MINKSVDITWFEIYLNLVGGHTSTEQHLTLKHSIKIMIMNNFWKTNMSITNNNNNDNKLSSSSSSPSNGYSNLSKLPSSFTIDNILYSKASTSSAAIDLTKTNKRNLVPQVSNISTTTLKPDLSNVNCPLWLINWMDYNRYNYLMNNLAESNRKLEEVNLSSSSASSNRIIFDVLSKLN